MVVRSNKSTSNPQSEEELAIIAMDRRVVMAELKARLAEARLRELKANSEYVSLRPKPPGS